MNVVKLENNESLSFIEVGNWDRINSCRLGEGEFEVSTTGLIIRLTISNFTIVAKIRDVTASNS